MCPAEAGVQNATSGVSVEVAEGSSFSSGENAAINVAKDFSNHGGPITVCLKASAPPTLSPISNKENALNAILPVLPAQGPGLKIVPVSPQATPLSTARLCRPVRLALLTAP